MKEGENNFLDQFAAGFKEHLYRNVAGVLIYNNLAYRSLEDVLTHDTSDLGIPGFVLSVGLPLVIMIDSYKAGQKIPKNKQIQNRVK